jgi:hypothetical protein
LKEFDDLDALKSKFTDLEDLDLEEDDLFFRSDDEGHNSSNDDQEIPPVISLIEEDILKEVLSFFSSL